MFRLLQKANEYLAAVKKTGNITLLAEVIKAQSEANKAAEEARKLYEDYIKSIEE